MEELNNAQSVLTVEEEGYDTLTVIDLGDALSIAQVSEDDELQDLIIGPEQAAALIAKLQEFLG